MARGHPDWGIDVNSRSLFSIDNAELAVRLGSPDIVTRGGKVVYQDTFNQPALNWIFSSSTGDGKVWYSIEDSYLGDQHLRLRTDTTADHSTNATKYFPYAPDIYTSVSFYLTIPSDPKTTEFWTYSQDGTNRYIWAYKITTATNTISILTPGFTWNTIYTLYSLESAIGAEWHYIRLSYDTVNMEYISMIVNDLEIDISGENAYQLASTQEKWQALSYFIYSPGVTRGIIGIDGLVLKIEDYNMYI